MTIHRDLNFWLNWEQRVIDYLEANWFQIDRNNTTAIHDFVITHNWARVNIELKTRRCEKDKYSETLIWANKLGESWNKFYKNWEETLFFFQFTDWLYFINPLDYLPRREYKKTRFDRWPADQSRGWIYFNTDNLNKIC